MLFKSRNIFWIIPVLLNIFLSLKAQEPYEVTLFAEGFSSPVTITHAGDSRLFVVNQPGTISIVDSVGTVNPEPFMDISDKVIFGGEQGLLGLAFHPDYKNNGYFYVNYIGTGDSSHISRFTMLSGNPDKADPQSEMNILTIAQPYKNHNGGNLAFGPDGYLYIGFGDGGSGGDPENRAQNKNEFLGKMLRIDVDSGDPYIIPDSNPYSALSSARNEIWALGLRNPWRFSFDRKTGDLWIADVGQNRSEEINFQPTGSQGGENYGWRCYEGDLTFEQDGCARADSFIFPVYTYSHEEGCSVTGGFVYRGDSLSFGYGKYFFADYCSDNIWTLYKDPSGWTRGDVAQLTGNGFSAFGEDNNGELYIAGNISGNLYKITGGVTQISEKEPGGIQFYYDPESGKCRLAINTGLSHETILSIYDMRGIVRFSDKISDATYEFSTGFLPCGLYLISLRINGKDWSHKLMIK